MKQIELTPREFYEFKSLATLFHIQYICDVLYGMIVIEADALHIEHLGY